jgi:hypothetical protein
MTQSYSLAVAMVITPGSLATPVLNVAYSATFSAAGGTGPYTWSLASGTLPTGLSLSAAGVLSGTPTVPGTYSFQIEVTDSSAPTPLIVIKKYTLKVL